MSIINPKEIENAMNQYGDIVLSKNANNNLVIMSMQEYQQKMQSEQAQNVSVNPQVTHVDDVVKEKIDAVREWKARYKI